MSLYFGRLLFVHTPRFSHDMIRHDSPLLEETFSMTSVRDVDAEYTVTEKTIVIKSMTETLIADIIKIDLLIILNYITSTFGSNIL